MFTFQVKRMIGECGGNVVGLHREAVGPIELDMCANMCNDIYVDIRVGMHERTNARTHERTHYQLRWGAFNTCRSCELHALLQVAVSKRLSAGSLVKNQLESPGCPSGGVCIDICVLMCTEVWPPARPLSSATHTCGCLRSIYLPMRDATQRGTHGS